MGISTYVYKVIQISNKHYTQGEIGRDNVDSAVTDATTIGDQFKALRERALTLDVDAEIVEELHFWAQAWSWLKKFLRVIGYALAALVLVAAFVGVVIGVVLWALKG